MVEVIADTNILINLYGAFLHRDQNIKKLKPHTQLLKLIENNKIKIYATNQILKEFAFSKGSSFEAIKNFQTFFKKYVRPINFSNEDVDMINKLTHALGHNKISYTNEYNVLMRDQILFEQAERQGERNFADATIMAESIVASLPIVTINQKDFEGCKYCKTILEKYNITFRPKVLSVHDLISILKSQEQIF